MLDVGRARACLRTVAYVHNETFHTYVYVGYFFITTGPLGYSDTGYSDTSYSDTGYSDTGYSDTGYSDTL